MQPRLHTLLLLALHAGACRGPHHCARRSLHLGASPLHGVARTAGGTGADRRVRDRRSGVGECEHDGYGFATTPVPMQATLTIHAAECSAHLVSIYRVYGNHTQFGEQVTLLDAVSQETVYVDRSTQRSAPVEEFICLPASQYVVVLSADSDVAWETHSTLTLALLTTDDSVVLYRGRLDQRTREASYRFSLEGPIAFHSSWSYHVLGIPSDPGGSPPSTPTGRRAPAGPSPPPRTLRKCTRSGSLWLLRRRARAFSTSLCGMTRVWWCS